MDKFESKTNWEAKAKLCKLTMLRDKNGQAYFIGDLNKNIKLQIQKITGNWGKDKKGNQLYQAFVVPITYTKIEEKAQDTADTFDDFDEAIKEDLGE